MTSAVAARDLVGCPGLIGNDAELDAACARAWARRGKALEIIRREMYARWRTDGIAAKREGVIWETDGMLLGLGDL